MTFAVNPRACLFSAILLAVPLVSCQSTSSQKPPPAPQTVTADPAPVVAETKVQAATQDPVQQAAVPDKVTQDVSEPAPESAPRPAPQIATVVAQPEDGQQTGLVNPEAELVFLDFAGFDEDLSREMSAEKAMIAVDVPAAFSLNDVPERLDRWFSRVKKTGGAVQARERQSEEERRTRGIVGVLLDIAVSAVKAHEAEEMLRPAEDYSVLVEYNKQTGKADRVLFYRR